MEVTTGYPLVYAAKHPCDGERRASASGGAFFSLAKIIIGEGGVVYGCAFNDELRAEHIRCTTLEEATRCQGSKYSQSNLGDCFAEVRDDLAAGRTVLFTGTPCQVAAVKAACGVQGPGTLYSVDILCHGVLSPEVFQQHLRHAEVQVGSPVARYEHRSKHMGWSHNERIVFENGHVEAGTPLGDSWRTLFYENRMLRPSCDRCPYTRVIRPSDMTIADFWGIQDTELASFADDLGVSLVLVNNATGADLLQRSGMVTRPAAIEDALPGNPMLQHPAVHWGDRTEPWRNLYDMGYSAMLAKRHYQPTFAWRVLRKGKRIVRRLLGRK